MIRSDEIRKCSYHGSSAYPHTLQLRTTPARGAPSSLLSSIPFLHIDIRTYRFFFFSYTHPSIGAIRPRIPRTYHQSTRSFIIFPNGHLSLSLFLSAGTTQFVLDTLREHEARRSAREIDSIVAPSVGRVGGRSTMVPGS